MGIVWGIVTVAIGALFFVWGRTRSEFVVYRLLAARSRILWGDRVHGFYRATGGILVLVGILLLVLA